MKRGPDEHPINCGCGGCWPKRTYLEKYERELRTRLEVHRGWMRRDTKVGRQW